MSKNSEPQLEAVLNRIKEAEKVQKDKDVAAVLEVDPRHLATWKSRGIIPYDQLVIYALKRNVLLDWLLFGRGHMQADHVIADPGAIYRVETNQDVVYQISGLVYQALHEIGGQVTASKFGEIVRHIHRDMLAHNEKEVPFEKVLSVVRLAI